MDPSNNILDFEDDSFKSYSYDGFEYISTFPANWITQYGKTMGPINCNNCLAFGSIIINNKQIFICYCLNCCKSFKNNNFVNKLIELSEMMIYFDKYPFITKEAFEYLLNITKNIYYSEKEIADMPELIDCESETDYSDMPELIECPEKIYSFVHPELESLTKKLEDLGLGNWGSTDDLHAILWNDIKSLLDNPNKEQIMSEWKYKDSFTSTENSHLNDEKFCENMPLEQSFVYVLVMCIYH
jgi:hypothetical protein